MSTPGENNSDRDRAGLGSRAVAKRPPSDRTISRRDALILAGGYWLVATLWVGFSDQALAVLGLPLESERAIAAIKGQLFVTVTAIVLYLVASRHLLRLHTSQARHRESEEYLDLAVRAANIGLWSWDLATDAVVYSQGWKRQLGYEPEEIADDFDQWRRLVHPDDLDAAETKVNHFLDGSLPSYRNEFRMRAKDGTYRWIMTQASFLLDASGAPVKLIGAHIDITDLKASEQRLLEHSEQLERTLDSAVMAMSNLVEFRDPYTAGHERRVAELANAIAARLDDFDRERRRALNIAALVHDVGKIGIPSDILVRPGKLDPIDFALIQQHPEIGHSVLEHVDFGSPIAQMIVQHHERMDGSGYPAGLSGDEILLEARILAVADVVESMMSHRPYRAALGMDAALDELRIHAGVKYDPSVVDACVSLFEDEGFDFRETA